MIITLFESPKVKLEFDDSASCIVWKPISFMAGDDWCKPFTLGMDYYVEHGITNWLNDTRDLKAVRPVDITWLDKNVNDRAYKANGKKVAFILPEAIFGKMAVRTYAKFTLLRPDNKLDIKAFYTTSSAKMWFRDKYNKNLKLPGEIDL